MAPVAPGHHDDHLTAPRLPTLTLDEVHRGDLVARFDAVAQAHGDRTALVDERGAITLAALADRSHDVARAVDERSGASRGPVAVLMGHRAAAITALLGVARSGRAFVGLDASVPIARLTQMQALAGADVVIVDASTAAIAEELAFPRGAIDVDQLPAGPHRAPTPSIAPPDPACVLFTSGSTGEPKGIVWHGGTILKDALAGQRFLDLGPTDRVGLVLPFSFAAGLSVVAWGLTTGASLHLFDPRQHPVTALAAWIDHQALTTIHTTPTLLRSLVRSLDPGRVFSSLRVVTTCGEPLRWSDVAAVRPHLRPGAHVVNWSGSTEVGVLAMHVVASTDSLDEGVVPAGAVVDGVEVVLEPVEDAGDGAPPVAGDDTGPVVGELVVTSDLVAVGYCGDPDELTARFGRSPAGRTYRTGDLATTDAAGALVLRGRRDAAVKIRGYLVEPAEVEAAILAAGGVSEVAVSALPRETGDLRLVAHVVPATGTALALSALRADLRRRLPPYMVPATIVPLAELPRTDRGKLDRAALAAMVPDRGVPHRSPVSVWEIRVAQAWSKALGVDEPGVDDDFFELGGDSLAAEEVLATLAALGPDLPSSTFARSPTIAGLARAAEAATRGDWRHEDVVQLRPGDGTGPTVVCFAGAGGIAIVFEFLARLLPSPVRVLAVQMHALERRGVPDYTVEAAARRFLRQLPGLAPNGPIVLAGHSWGGLVAFEVARRLEASGRRPTLLALLDSYLPQAVDATARPGRPGRGHRVLERWTALVPTDSGRPRRVTVPRMLLAGPRRYRGLEHFDGFFDRGYAMSRRYRPGPYAGRTVVYRAAQNVLPIDHLAWAERLTGEWTTVEIGGDHHSMLRHPFVADLASDLTTRITTGPTAP